MEKSERKKKIKDMMRAINRVYSNLIRAILVIGQFYLFLIMSNVYMDVEGTSFNIALSLLIIIGLTISTLIRLDYLIEIKDDEKEEKRKKDEEKKKR